MFAQWDIMQMSNNVASSSADVFTLCASVWQLNITSIWSQRTRVQLLESCRLQPRASKKLSVSRQQPSHPHIIALTHCETSGELTSETRASITANVGTCSACCFSFLLLPRVTVVDRVQQVPQTTEKSHKITRNTWPGWAGPVQQSNTSPSH